MKPDLQNGKLDLRNSEPGSALENVNLEKRRRKRKANYDLEYWKYGSRIYRGELRGKKRG